MAEAEASATSPPTSPVIEPEIASSAVATSPEVAPVETAEEVAPLAEEDSSPAMETDAPKEPEDASAALVISSEPDEILNGDANHKRKLEDLEEKQAVPTLPPAEETLAAVAPDEVGPEAEQKAVEPATAVPIAADDEAVPAKRPRLDGETDVSDLQTEAPATGNGQPPSTEMELHVPVNNFQAPNNSSSFTGEQQTVSRIFQVPNNKVGVLIGKSGETIRVLQLNSGAKIQITRDAEADPNSSSRPVELVGPLESINKAEQLIKDVIAEAEAGGSPALVARGFGNAQSGSEQHEMHVPNEKVGWIIGKGGETIKNLQTRSGARIQLIPQHLPDGDAPKERIVRVTGNKKQIEAAKEMIKEVLDQAPVKRTPQSGGYNQQTFRPRGPNPQSQWGTRAPAPAPAPAKPATGYDYQQQRGAGMYPPQSTQYPPQQQPLYGSYNTQHAPPPRSSTNTGWDPRAMAPSQTGGYNSNNYYGQGGQVSDNQPIPAAAPSAAPVNYSYGPSQGYGQQTPYTQSAPTQQQNYGQGYNEQKYDTQPPTQQFYGQQQQQQQQPGAYPAQADYTQQQAYSKPAYDGAPQSYGLPRASQPGDPMYQGAAPSSYGSGGPPPTQQSYPYAQSAATQPAPAYGQAYGGPTSGTPDGGYAQPYTQQSSQVAPGYAQPAPASYPQQVVQQPAPASYPQQGVQPAPASYPQQGVQSGGYGGQYPPQQSYGEQSVANNVNYGYQGGPAEAGYGGNSVPSSGYGSVPPGYGQAGYPQQQSYPSGYEQSVQPQPGYGGHPGSAPAGYAKGVSPQPGYGSGQYYST